MNNKNRKWSVVFFNWDQEEGNEDGVDATIHYVLSLLAPPKDPTHTMDDDIKAQIAQQLADHITFLNKKDYRTADRIRYKLMEGVRSSRPNTRGQRRQTPQNTSCYPLGGRLGRIRTEGMGGYSTATEAAALSFDLLTA